MPARKVGRRKTGRHERALDRSVREAGLDRPIHSAIVSLCRAYARSLDVAEAKSDAYAIGQSGKAYLEVLIQTGLADSREGATASADSPFAGMGDAEMGDAAHTG